MQHGRTFERGEPARVVRHKFLFYTSFRVCPVVLASSVLSAEDQWRNAGTTA